MGAGMAGSRALGSLPGLGGEWGLLGWGPGHLGSILSRALCFHLLWGVSGEPPLRLVSWQHPRGQLCEANQEPWEGDTSHQVPRQGAWGWGVRHWDPQAG